MSSIILKEKQAKILTILSDNTQKWYIANLAKSANTTYVHACNFINTCERLNIIKSEKHGKIKTLSLTEKGIKIAGYISGIYGIISERQKTDEIITQKEQIPKS